MLEAIDTDVPGATHSRSLFPLLSGAVDAVRDWAIYGYWGSAMNVTDGRYTYHHPNRGNEPPYCHSTIIIDPYGWFVPPTVHEDAEADQFLPYTDSPVWRYTPEGFDTPAEHLVVSVQQEDPLLFDTESDPHQTENLVAAEPEQTRRMRDRLVDAIASLQAPDAEFHRLGLDR